jgi:hypothetical protein
VAFILGRSIIPVAGRYASVGANAAIVVVAGMGITTAKGAPNAPGRRWHTRGDAARPLNHEPYQRILVQKEGYFNGIS